jgi:hypothetical protein
MSSFEDDTYDDPFARPLEELEPVIVGSLSKTPPEKTITTELTAHRRKEGPSQADRVLLSYLDPNRPDLWRQGGRTVLRVSLSPPDRQPQNSASAGAAVTYPTSATPAGASAVEEEGLDERVSRGMRERAQREEEENRQKKLEEMRKMEAARAASQALFRWSNETPQSTPTPPLPDHHPDHHMRELPPLQDAAQRAQSNSMRHPIGRGLMISVPSSSATLQRDGPPTPLTSIPPMDTRERRPSEPANMGSSGSVTSPPSTDQFVNGRFSPSSPSTAGHYSVKSLYRAPPTPGHRLPPITSTLQSPDVISPEATEVNSPKGDQKLPGVRPLLEIAEHENKSRPRDNSIGSTAAPSPSFYVPSSSVAYNYPSPASAMAMSPNASREFTRHPSSTATSPYYPALNGMNRRHSQASDMFQAFHSNGAVSVSDSYGTSPETATFSPDTQTGTATTTPSDSDVHMGGRPRAAMSLSGPQAPLPLALAGPAPSPGPLSANSILPGPGGAYTNPFTLPPPIGPAPPAPGASMHSVMAAHVLGGFICDYPGCEAPPFQTQYLLK